MSTVECGAACLAMILRAHGIPATLADCRRYLSPGPKGVNALSLSEAALKFGLRARAYSAPDRAAVEELPLPAILHFENNHFVVLEERSDEKVSIIDPGEGRRKLGWSELQERYSGIALAFEPSPAPPEITPRAARPGDVVRELLRIPGVRRLAVQLIAATLFIHLLGLLFPLAAGSLVDRATLSVNVLGAGIAALALALIFLRYLRASLLVFFGSRAATALALGFPSLSDPGADDDLTRHLVRRARYAAAHQAVSIFVDLLWMIIASLALLVIAPSFLGIALTAAALQAALLLGRGRSLAVPSWRSQEPSGRALDLLDHLTSDRDSSWIKPALAAVGASALVLLLWIGTHRILQLEMTAGTVLAAASLAGQLLWPLVPLLSAWQRLRSMGPHVQALA